MDSTDTNALTGPIPKENGTLSALQPLWLRKSVRQSDRMGIILHLVDGGLPSTA
jgi:hypothetical protein